MAKFTEEYIRRAFYQRFATLPEPDQRGIIEGLTAVMLCRLPKQPELFDEAEQSE